MQASRKKNPWGLQVCTLSSADESNPTTSLLQHRLLEAKPLAHTCSTGHLCWNDPVLLLRVARPADTCQLLGFRILPSPPSAGCRHKESSYCFALQPQSRNHSSVLKLQSLLIQAFPLSPLSFSHFAFYLNLFSNLELMSPLPGSLGLRECNLTGNCVFSPMRNIQTFFFKSAWCMAAKIFHCHFTF